MFRLALLVLLAGASAAASNPRNAALIISVDQAAQTVTVDTGLKPRITVDNEAPHNEKIYKVNELTSITLNGLKAEFADLKQGMRIHVVIGSRGDTAASITAYETPPKTKKKVAWNDRKAFSKIEMDRILSITDKTITVASSKSQRARSYQIGELTEVRVEGKLKTIDALKPGMKVSLTISHDPSVAAVIAVSE